MASLEPVIVTRLVKEKDLNHHGTLFAGQMAEWFVEACFITACRAVGSPEEVVCVKIHGLEFKTPITKGDILTFRALPARAGRTSVTVFCKVTKNDSTNLAVQGFATFVKVNADGRPVPHAIVLPEPQSEEEQQTRQLAENLR